MNLFLTTSGGREGTPMEVESPEEPPRIAEPERPEVLEIEESDEEAGARGSTSPDSTLPTDACMEEPEVDDGFDLDQGEPDLHRYRIPQS